MNKSDIKILVVGCGGLGGYVIESLVRMNFLNITVCDGDKFEPSNINRQILAMPSTLNKNKADIAVERAKAINPNINIVAINTNFTSENGKELVDKHDIVFDCLDNVSSRLDLEEICSLCHKPLIHGAINGNNGQVAFIKPNDNLLHLLYNGKADDKVISNYSSTVAIVANLEVNELVKFVENKSTLGTRELLTIDLETLNFVVVTINN